MQIHELNNYTGDLDSGAYLAVDNGSDTGKVSTTELFADTNAAVSQLDTVLNGRIDNIVAGGEAPSTSEIVDARYGADGVTYPSLGAAIRYQVTDLKSDLDNYVKKDVVWENVEINLETGVKSYKTLETFGTIERYKHCSIPVSDGDELKVTCYSNNSEYVGAFLYNSVDGSKVIILNGDTTGYVNEEIKVNGEYDTLYLNTFYQLSDYPLSATRKTFVDNTAKKEDINIVKEETDLNKTNLEYSDFEIKNLERRVLKAEKGNDFAWKEFDKPYFVFIQDDTNEYLESFAQVFLDNSVPFSASAVVANLNDTKVSILNDIVTNGGEILAHYSGSPNESSTDEEWLSITRDVKKALEEKGFEIRGIIRADNTASSTYKGEKYCRKYFDYANRGMGQSTQYNIPRMGMWNYETLEDFISQIDSDSTKNGIHAYGFHGKSPDKDWLTPENFTTIINHIKNIGGCEFATYRDIFDTFGTTVLEKRLSALENA